ncbi:MAG: 2-C-methyl-D-erythritol 2,4-cyclodiphosphate synthase [Phycisphaerales bacterium]
MGATPNQSRFRIGHGYDLHRLEPIGTETTGQGVKPLVLGGVRIEHDRGPVAHSDGDALLHAVTDAILGALALPDIGQLFPDTDPRHESQDSSVFLHEAVRHASSRGYRVVNLDATVILERPKLSPHKEAMRERVAAILGVDRSCVNIKGKTHERVDAVGEGRAVEVHVVVLLEAMKELK